MYQSFTEPYEILYMFWGQQDLGVHSVNDCVILTSQSPCEVGNILIISWEKIIKKA